MSTLKDFALWGSLVALTTSCQPKLEETSQAVHRYLYVASGQCFSGNGVTTFNASTSSNLIFKVDTETGVRDGIIADYFSFPASAGDTPISISDWDESHLAVFVRNGNSGRLELLPKKGGTRNTFGTTPAMTSIISTAPQNMKKASDGGLLLIRTGYIEKISSSGMRQTSPYVNNN